ncbi:hypothetical protein D3C80_942040 [compost metagenome]
MRQRHRADLAVAHQRHHAVAMPAQHQRRDIPGRKPGLLGDETLHARGIQHPRLPEHLVAPKAADAPGAVGEHIDRVGHHQHRRCRRMLFDVGHDAVEDWQVDAQYILARLAGLARHACGNYHQLGAVQHVGFAPAVNTGIGA